MVTKSPTPSSATDDPSDVSDGNIPSPFPSSDSSHLVSAASTSSLISEPRSALSDESIASGTISDNSIAQDSDVSIDAGQDLSGRGSDLSDQDDASSRMTSPSESESKKVKSRNKESHRQKGIAVEPTKVRKESRPGASRWSQRAIRFIALYTVPVILTLPISLLLALNTSLLTPLYNTLPLTLHSNLLYVAFAIPPALLYWSSTAGSAPRLAISGRVCLSIAALAGDVAAVSGRRVGSELGRWLGPEIGACVSRFIMGLGSIGGGTMFALLCFDHISPLSVIKSPRDRIRNLLFILIRSGAYATHVWFVERLWQSWAPSWNAERTLLFISLLLTVLSFFVRPSPPSSSVPERAYRFLTANIPTKSALRRPIRKATSFLPRDSFPILLLSRIPLIVLALRQHIFLRPLPPYIAAHGALRVLSSEKSLTGQVVVAENVRDGYRFMRCDHSILGGKWFRQVEDKKGVSRIDLGDSIFATFPLQEVAVLAHRHDPDESAFETVRLTSELDLSPGIVAGTELDELTERALIIGLGIGIAAGALSKIGYQVDIVEIDPAVSRAAFNHFGLNSTSIASTSIMDGAEYIHNVAEQHRGGLSNATKWSYIIQDCFTGGSVPAELFTVEFWEDIKAVLVDDGVLTMNFVGLLKSKAARAVLVTLLSSFSQCRAFGDSAEKERGPKDIVNMVVFCTMTHSPLLTFRRPVAADVMRSPIRSHVYSTFHQNEIQLDEIIQESDWEDKEMTLRKGSTSSMEGWQVETALATWWAMQEILTPAMWLAY